MRKGLRGAVMWRKSEKGKETGARKVFFPMLHPVCLEPYGNMGEGSADHIAMYHLLTKSWNMGEGIWSSSTKPQKCHHIWLDSAYICVLREVALLGIVDTNLSFDGMPLPLKFPEISKEGHLCPYLNGVGQNSMKVSKQCEGFSSLTSYFQVGLLLPSPSLEQWHQAHQ